MNGNIDTQMLMEIALFLLGGYNAYVNMCMKVEVEKLRVYMFENFETKS